MSEPRTFSRGDLTTFRGVDHDVLQFWFRENLLIPEPAPPRKHRRFSEDEAKIAALLGEARSQGMNLAALRVLAEKVRMAQRFRSDLVSQLGESATLDDELAAVENDPEQCELLMFAWNLNDCAGLIGLHCDDNDKWHLDTLRGDGGMKFRSEVVFNLGHIFESFKQ